MSGRQEVPTLQADPRPDSTLLACARAGDDHAFNVLVRRHARAALAVAAAVVGDIDQAEDVCQDAIFRVWQRLGECRDPGRFGAWLAMAVRRHALNALRSPRGTGIEGVRLASPEPGPDRQAETADLRARLESGLNRLTSDQRSAVTLFDLEGWSHAEIAAVLETTEAMSRQHLMLGRRRLRQLLEEQGESR